MYNNRNDHGQGSCGHGGDRSSPCAFMRYGVAALSAVIAVAVTLLCWNLFFSRNEFALLYAAVIVAAWYGGIGPGLLATGLGVWAICYFMSPALLAWRHVGNLVATGASVAYVAALVSTLEALRSRAMQAMRRAKEAAESANRAKDEFLAVLSHELRTPLTPALIAASGLAANPDLPPDVRSEPSMVRRNIELEARLIDDLLDLTRVTHGKLQLAREPIDVHALIGQVVEICQEDARANQLDVCAELTCEQPYINADPARISQVLWNLLKNAVKFTPAGGRVTVRTWSEPPGGESMDAHVIVEVTDTGLGIDPQSLPRIFDAFEQGDRAKAHQFGGLGLGLAISRALVLAHGGDLSAASGGTGHGATFTLTLARTAVAPVAVAVRTTSSATATALRDEPAGATLSASACPLRVLLVEDHSDTSRIISRLLRAMGYDVRVAEGVQEGLEAAKTPFDLLISDIGLRDGTGLDLMRAVRQQFDASALPPAIALSGYGMEEDVRRSHEAGFLAHLTKPIQFAALEATIRQLSRHQAVTVPVSA